MGPGYGGLAGLRSPYPKAPKKPGCCPAQIASKDVGKEMGRCVCRDAYPPQSAVGLAHQNHVVEHVNDTVVSLDIGCNHRCIFDFKAFGAVDWNGGALKRIDVAQPN
jgi:hypothetical protein